MKPYSPACERNRSPILGILRRVFADRARVLEIGSGTGQHAVHFGAGLPHLVWQPSDLPECHPGILGWLREADLGNVREPIALDVRAKVWPLGCVDAAFSANVVHIIGWAAVDAMFAGLGRHLTADGVLVLYGPFNYGGRYTAPSNREFDRWLRSRDPDSGIRDVEALTVLAQREGLWLDEDIAMPANNAVLVFRRSRTPSPLTRPERGVSVNT